MPPTILHAEPFRSSSGSLTNLYVTNDGNYAPGQLHAFIYDRMERVPWGRGSPQGWAMRGDPFAFVRGIGIRTSTMINPRSPGPTLGVAFAYSQGGSVGGSQICEFGTEDGRQKLMSLETDDAGHLVVYGAAARDAATARGTALATSSYVMPTGTGASNTPHTHLEIIPTLSSSAGGFQVWANGTRVLNLANANTGVGAIGLIQFMMQAARLVTDWIITDGSARLGDSRAVILVSSAAATYTAGTAVGAGSLLDAVKDIDHNFENVGGATDDDTYGTLDDTSLPKGMSFTTEALPADCKQVFAAGPFVLPRKDDAGDDAARLLLISAGTEDAGTSDIAITNSYTPTARLSMTDPDTAAAWTIPGCDAAEVGYRRTV